MAPVNASPPDTSPPQSLPPVSTPEPAATSTTVQSARPTTQPLPPVSAYPSYTFSPLPQLSKPAGRSKAERWSHGSPASGGSVSPPGRASYREVLLASAAPDVAALSMESSIPPVVRTPVTMQPRPPCQHKSATVGTIHSEVYHGRLGGRGPDAVGFQLVLRRRRRRDFGVRHPVLGGRRQVPDDLKNKCFNCFSTAHRAAECRRQTCCFRCRRPGHRSS